ncbi:MAG: acyltransferase family protein, partial [Terriglobales bacterium]
MNPQTNPEALRLAVTGPAEKTYRPDIDGLRAIAIISVALFHSGVCPGGFSGVDLFFTISGFLIGGHIYAELRDGKFSFLRFYYRRAKRILPALFTVLIAIQAVSMLLLSPAESVLVGRDTFAATLSVSNIMFWKKAGYFAPSSELNPLLMTWSLGVEEQFYMIIPILMVLLTRARKNLLVPFLGLICVASFVYAWVQLPTHPSAVFYLIQSRAWEIGAGVLLAVLSPNFDGAKEKHSKALQWISIVGLLMVLVPMAWLSRQTPFPGPAALPSVAGAVFLIASRGSWINRHLLALRPLVFTGRVSYSWYLWHWPVLAFLRVILGRPLSSVEGGLAVTFAFALAIPSYFLIEQPLRHTARSPAQLLLRYGLAGVVMLCLGGAIWGSGGVPLRYPALAARESAAVSDILSDPCIIRNVSSRPNLSERCYQQTEHDQFVALWGDSHAAAVAPAVRSIAYKYGYGFREVNMASCPPLPGVFFLSRKNPEYQDLCQRFNHQVLDLISRD